MAVSLDPLEPSEVDTFASLVVALYDDDPGPVAMDHARAAAQARLMLRQPSGAHPLLVRVDGAVAGYVILATFFSNELGGWMVFLDELFVRSELRGLGIGGEVLERVKAWAQARGYVRVALEVNASNPRARRLYERHGFAAFERTTMSVALTGSPPPKSRQP